MPTYHLDRFATLSCDSQKDWLDPSQAFQLGGGVQVFFQSGQDKSIVSVIARTSFEGSETLAIDDSELVKARELAEAALLIVKDLLALKARSDIRIQACKPMFAVFSENGMPRKAGDWQMKDALLLPKVEFKTIDLTKDLSSMIDRMDAISLFSEAMTYEDGIGKFLNFWKIFENAFAQGGFALSSGKLTEFLITGGYDYTAEEIEQWRTIRSAGAHADLKFAERIAFDIDAIPHLGRLEQASLDVLFNKMKWWDKGTDRRQMWTPTTFIRRERGHFRVKKHHPVSIQFVAHDAYTGWAFSKGEMELKGNCIWPTLNAAITAQVEVVD